MNDEKVPYATKQVIVARTDLNMRKGKLAAQVAHASLKVFLDRRANVREHVFPVSDISIDPPASAVWKSPPLLMIPLTASMQEWVEGTFAKIVLGVDSEADLLTLYESAKAAGLPTALVQDVGNTEFHGVPTYTTIAIGPAASEAIDKITRNGPVKTRLL